MNHTAPAAAKCYLNLYFLLSTHEFTNRAYQHNQGFLVYTQGPSLDISLWNMDISQIFLLLQKLVLAKRKLVTFLRKDDVRFINVICFTQNEVLQPVSVDQRAKHWQCYLQCYQRKTKQKTMLSVEHYIV